MTSAIVMSLIGSLVGGGMLLSSGLDIPADMEAKIKTFVAEHPGLEVEIKKEVNGQEVKIEFKSEDGMVEKRVEVRNDSDNSGSDSDENRVEIRVENEDGALLGGALDEFRAEFRAENEVEFEHRIEIEDGIHQDRGRNRNGRNGLEFEADDHSGRR